MLPDTASAVRRACRARRKGVCGAKDERPAEQQARLHAALGRGALAELLRVGAGVARLAHRAVRERPAGARAGAGPGGGATAGLDSDVTDTRADSTDGAAWGAGNDCPEFDPGNLSCIVMHCRVLSLILFSYVVNNT